MSKPVLSIEQPDLDDKDFSLPHLIPQTQEPLPMMGGPRNQAADLGRRPDLRLPPVALSVDR
jgi:hypothetical protein